VCHAFPVQNGLKKSETLSALLFFLNFASEYAVTKNKTGKKGRAIPVTSRGDP
jgi:hypothetical protein